MFEYDICLCASEECPRYDDCIRGRKTKREGIYTTSLLSEICNEDTKYECFIGDDKK